MPTLLELTKTTYGDHTPLIRVVTALLDDHAARTLASDLNGAMDSMHSALRCMIDGSYAEVDLTREVRAVPDSDSKDFALVPTCVYVLPFAALHIDPWTRITAWGSAYGLRLHPSSDNYSQELGRTLSRVLKSLGALDSLDVYAHLHTTELTLTSSREGAVIDLLVENARRIPRVQGCSPWWVASVLSRGRHRNALGPATRAMMPPPDEE